MSEVVMHAEDVHKSFGKLLVLKGVSLEVTKGETVCIIGPSGSGKTTFIRCVNHLEKIDSGRIEVNGHLIGYRQKGDRLVEDSERNIARQRTEIGMVFQRFNLFPHKTALENVIEAPVHVLKTPKGQAAGLGKALLERVGLGDKLDTYPGKLSGGQQQRVAIARALVTEPEILMADEPTGNLDSARTEEVMKLLQRLNHERGITIVMVTHEPDVAAFAKRSLVFRDGRILSDNLQEPRA
jgi:polar amino acid transport system ATP-binding protein